MKSDFKTCSVKVNIDVKVSDVTPIGTDLGTENRFWIAASKKNFVLMFEFRWGP